MNKPLDLLGKWELLQLVTQEQFALTRSAHCVVNRLLQHQNFRTGRCDPSIIGIADYTGLSRKSVQNAIRELREKGIIEVVRRTRGTRNSYRFINPPGPRAGDPFKEGKLASQAEEAGFPKVGKGASLEKRKEKIKKKSLARRPKQSDGYSRSSTENAENGQYDEKRCVKDLQGLENDVSKYLSELGLRCELLVLLSTDVASRIYAAYKAQEMSFLEAKTALINACLEFHEQGGGCRE